MKNKIIIIIGILICINSCRMPSDPVGGISIVKRLETINTGGNCLDIDVDIIDNILVAAANYNGYFMYKINLIDGIVSDISEQKHVAVDAMDTNLGDNRAQSVILSKEHNIAFVMDQYDHIWLYKYEDGSTQYDIPNYLEEDCYGSTWLSVAIDDQNDSIGVYTLLKHNAAEDEAAEFLEYSTSLVWTSLKGIDPSSISPNQDEPNCEYIINQNSIAEMIYFDDGLLSMAYGELGVKVFKQTELEVCLITDDIVDLSDDALCSENYDNSGEIDYKSCCENTACPGGMGECPWMDEGFEGVFSSAGGIIPQIYAQFDTPGEVESLFSKGNTIFSGLKYSNGCVMSILDDDGNIINTNQFAIGYSVTGIHQNNGLLALAAGHDGILLYNLSGSNVSFMGKIETSYANAVKIAGDIIFAATEDGIEVIQIDFTQ